MVALSELKLFMALLCCTYIVLHSALYICNIRYRGPMFTLGTDEMFFWPTIYLAYWVRLDDYLCVKHYTSGFMDELIRGCKETASNSL